MTKFCCDLCETEAGRDQLTTVSLTLGMPDDGRVLSKKISVCSACLEYLEKMCENNKEAVSV